MASLSRYPKKIFAITGPTCSGKTTLGENLKSHYGDDISIVPLDDLTLTRQQLEAIGEAPFKSAIDGSINYEHPDVYQTHLYPSMINLLNEGRTVRMPANLRISREAGITERLIQPRKYVAFVGFVALHNPNARYTGTGIYLDLPEGEMVRRRMAFRPEHPNYQRPYIDNVLIPSNRAYVLPKKWLVPSDHRIDATLPPEEVAARAIELIER